MKLQIDDKFYKLEIVKKRTNRNTYIMVKEDLTILVTTNIFTSDKKINQIINENIDSIKKMIERASKKKEYEEKFYYLGREYDLVYTNSDSVSFGEKTAFVGKNVDFDKWLKTQAQDLFLQRLDLIYSKFSRRIPYPTMTIRKMKSRWGVCNVKTHRVTLNLNLMKKDISCLDYVIVHELSHLVYADHSKRFWGLVEENYPEYKKVRKMMKEY